MHKLTELYILKTINSILHCNEVRIETISNTMFVVIKLNNTTVVIGKGSIIVELWRNTLSYIKLKFGLI